MPLKKRLRPGGIVIVQALEFSFLDDKMHVALSRTLRTVFSQVHSYRAHIPSFLSSWGYLIASDWFEPGKWSADEVDATIQVRLGTDWLDHLSGEFLRGCFAMCKETRFFLSLSGPILEDNVPFVPPPNVEDVELPLATFPILPER